MSSQELKGLFKKHRQALYFWLLRKTDDHHLAADLAQESFVRLIEQRAAQVSITNSSAWLYRTANNLLIDHFRQQTRRCTDTVCHERLASLEAFTSSTEDVAHARIELQRMQQALAELPSRTREIFQLNRVEGMTHREVARHLGISDSSVQKHLSKALAHVMGKLANAPES